MIAVDWQEEPKLTHVPDSFITSYMKEAPGEYVKLYLYLLMLSQKNSADLSVQTLSDAISCSPEDVHSGLNYWKKQKLMDVTYQGKEISGIRLRINPAASPKEIHQLSPARVQAFVKDNDDARRLLFVAEQYFGRRLTATDIRTLLYFMDELHFSFDLCDQLIQYCVEKGHTSIRYLEKVGLAWHESGYTTPEEAKAASTSWSKIHFDVLKAFGINNRNPIPKEVEYIDRWYKTYCFSLEVIAEACAITLHKTGEQRFDYAEGILSRWHAEGLHTLADIRRQNEEYKARQKQQPKDSAAAAPEKQPKKSKNQFLNFPQRKDDPKELEKMLDRQFAEMELDH